MTPSEYVQHALRTESKIENVKTNPLLLCKTLLMFTALGTILDCIKKQVFYGKPFDEDKLATALHELWTGFENYGDAVGSRDEHEPIDINPRIFHAVVGVATEAVELIEAISNGSNDTDRVNLLEETGDINWYQAILIDELGGNFEKVLETNIEKLRARFPQKFTNEDAIDRDIETERTILERGSN